MSERTLEQALAHAADVKQRGNNHCLMCDNPKDESERKHSEHYLAQLNADAYCVLLADEIERMRPVVEAAIQFRRAETAAWVESEVGIDESAAQAKAERPRRYVALVDAVDALIAARNSDTSIKSD